MSSFLTWDPVVIGRDIEEAELSSHVEGDGFFKSSDIF